VGARPGDDLGAFIFVGRAEADENSGRSRGYFRRQGPGPRKYSTFSSVKRPTKITVVFSWADRRKYSPAHENLCIFVGQEADENNCRIFVSRPTKIFRPTKIYVFPVVKGTGEIVVLSRSTTTAAMDMCAWLSEWYVKVCCNFELHRNVSF
jgi:hypothetical protein